MARQKRRYVAHAVLRKYWSTRIDLGKKGFDSVDEFLEPGTCFACGRSDPENDNALTRAHIKPRDQGGADDKSNIHILCQFCHTASEALSGDGYWNWFYRTNLWTVAQGVYAMAGHNLYDEMLTLTR